ncbi:MAG: hemolysin family protein [Candidatus Latescibacterota bacterium]
MEPAQFLAVLVGLASLVGLFVSASYEATFAVLSRSALERLVESGARRARALLRVYEPRHRLRLLARLGAAVGMVGLSFSLYSLARSLQAGQSVVGGVATAAAAASALLLYLLVSVPHRVRLEEEGQEPHIPLLTLTYVPLHALLLPLTNLLDHFASGDYSDEDFRAEKEEELRSLVESESESGIIEEGEREMIQGVFGFHDRIVREVMVPRVDVVAVETSATLADLLRLIQETGHSRVPVYEETLDRIRGLVYAKDLLQLLVRPEPLDLDAPLSRFLEPREGSGGPQTCLLHEPHYVPETKKIDDLLHEMRLSRVRLAVVFDEYGGTAGLVSTEDLVEEIVGELQDEYDDEQELYHWVEPNEVLIVNARMDIDDLNEILESDLPNEGFETLGGYIYDHLGSIPQEGQAFQTGNLEVKILRVEGQRISEVQIRRLALAAEKPTVNGKVEEP